MGKWISLIKINFRYHPYRSLEEKFNEFSGARAVRSIAKMRVLCQAVFHQVIIFSKDTPFHKLILNLRLLLQFLTVPPTLSILSSLLNRAKIEMHAFS